MDKFLFEPSRGEMAAALCLLFSPQLPPADVDALLAAFPHQPMDFFGAIKSRMVDGAVRSWLHDAAAAAAGGGGGGGGGEVRMWQVAHWDAPTCCLKLAQSGRFPARLACSLLPTRPFC
jgi:hypothetical protein